MTRAIALAAFAGAFLLAATAGVSMPLPPGEHARNYLSKVDNTFQPYHLFVPSAAEEGEPLPLAVVLHGRGATWQSWFHATTVTDWAEAEGFFVAAPHGRGDWFYRGPGEQDVLDVMAEVEALFPIDNSRIFVLGHSMGGYGALHLASSYPDRFASVVAMSCWAPEDRLENLRHARPLLIHGLRDDVVPPEWTARAADRLEELGITHRDARLPGRAHESSLISDALLFIGEWIRGTTLPEDPQEISLRLYTPSHGAAWWLQALQVRTPGDLAGIDAIVDEEEGILRIDTSNLRSFAIRRGLPGLGDSGYTIELDGEGFALPEEEGSWLHFERERRTWNLSALDTRPYPTIPEFGVASHVPECISQAIARTLRNRMDADVVLIPEAYVAPEVLHTHWTLDVVLDLFLHPQDELHTADLTPAEFDALMENRANWFPRWWDDLVRCPPLPEEESPQPASSEEQNAEEAEEELLRIAFPAVLAEKIPHESAPSGITIRRTLVEHIASGQLLRE